MAIFVAALGAARLLALEVFVWAARARSVMADGITRRRVGFTVGKGAPARQGSAILSEEGKPIGEITSGGFSPTIGANMRRTRISCVPTRHPPPSAVLRASQKDERIASESRKKRRKVPETSVATRLWCRSVASLVMACGAVMLPLILACKV